MQKHFNLLTLKAEFYLKVFVVIHKNDNTVKSAKFGHFVSSLNI